jgi:ketopantoate reductase
MKLAVLGPGALGCLLSALFREAGADVSLVDYRPDRVARLRLRGIQVHGPSRCPSAWRRRWARAI